MEGSKLDILNARQYAWDYFIAHAQARLATFRFYLFYCSVIMAGMFTALTKGNILWLGAILSFLLSFMSWIYLKVDIRHKQMINRAQEALMEIASMMDLPDQNAEPNKLKLFTREKYITSKMPRFPKVLTAKAHCSYSMSVKMVFYTFIGIGIIGGIGMLIYHFHYLLHRGI